MQRRTFRNALPVANVFEGPPCARIPGRWWADAPSSTRSEPSVTEARSNKHECDHVMGFSVCTTLPTTAASRRTRALVNCPPRLWPKGGQLQFRVAPHALKEVRARARMWEPRLAPRARRSRPAHHRQLDPDRRLRLPSPPPDGLGQVTLQRDRSLRSATTARPAHQGAEPEPKPRPLRGGGAANPLPIRVDQMQHRLAGGLQRQPCGTGQP